MPLDSLTRRAVPPEWVAGMDALRNLPEGGCALLVGATDQGKTTFAALAARLLASEIGDIAVVDADIGQSEIGPPGTVGVAWGRDDMERLSDLKPLAKFFVGGFSPPRVAMELVTATARAVQHARRAQAKRIVIDTTGFVSGPSARRIKTQKARLTQPSLLLGFGDAVRDDLLPVLASATGVRAIAMPTSALARRKPTGLRTTRRLTRLAAEMNGLRELHLPLGTTGTVGATLGTGQPLTPELLRWSSQALRLPLTHAEIEGSTLTVWLPGLPRRDWEAGSLPVTAHFRVQTLRALSWAAHEGVLVGLGDGAGRLLSVGRFSGWDAERQELIVFAPPPAASENVRLIEWGRVRLAPDAQPLGDVRAGDL